MQFRGSIKIIKNTHIEICLWKPAISGALVSIFHPLRLSVTYLRNDNPHDSSKPFGTFVATLKTGMQIIGGAGPSGLLNSSQMLINVQTRCAPLSWLKDRQDEGTDRAIDGQRPRCLFCEADPVSPTLVLVLFPPQNSWCCDFEGVSSETPLR